MEPVGGRDRLNRGGEPLERDRGGATDGVEADREPACRSFIKNEWMKLARERELEVRPDRIAADDYAAWHARQAALAAIHRAD